MTANECALDSAEIRISGLKGGHSGAEIDKGRANATITLGRVLQALVDKLDVRLVSAEGGLKDNAIPNAARAVIALEDGSFPARRKSAPSCKIRSAGNTPLQTPTSPSPSHRAPSLLRR